MMQGLYFGHACFVLDVDGYRICLDPYGKVDGYGPLQISAHQVLCSHDHHDHNAVDRVKLLPWDGPSPVTVRTIETYHDGAKGALRGKNTIHLISDGKTTVAHMGDLGHSLNEQQMKELQGVDVMLLPVGGTFTIDGTEAAGVWKQVGCPTVVPMHYRREKLGFFVLGTLDKFARKCPDAEVKFLEGKCFALEKSEKKVILVPTYEGGLLE